MLSELEHWASLNCRARLYDGTSISSVMEEGGREDGADVPLVEIISGRLFLAYLSAASETQTISLSLRTYIDLLAKAGCDQSTLRSDSGVVGARMCARSISS
jgi:hypothetical protein